MADKAPLENPTNRIVAAFPALEQAERAVQASLARGISRNEIRLLNGVDDARQIDTSPKWFADTDLDIARYKRALEDDCTIISVPVGDEVEAEAISSLCKEHGANLITHFGNWITEVIES